MEYADHLKTRESLLINNSLKAEPRRIDIFTYKVAATGITDCLKRTTIQRTDDKKNAAHSILLGYYLSVTKKINLPILRDVFNNFLLEKAAYFELNFLGTRQGYEYTENQEANRLPSILV
jgi:hypothetical protein